MNREIKFRCWDKEDNKMLSHEELKDINWSYSGLTKEDDNYVLMQYTGLKDRSRIDIYEGDLIIEESVIRQVIYQNGSFKIKGLDKTDIAFDMRNDVCKVVGNIYENKELLGD